MTEDEVKTEDEAKTEPQQINIAEAFKNAQSQIGKVAKRSINPHFKSKFVDLATLNDAIIPVLNENNLSLMQRIDMIADRPHVITQVFDSVGHSMPASRYPIITKDDTDPQKFGAGVTYARRYSLMAYFGIAGDDDDGTLAATPAPNPLNELGRALKSRGDDTKDKVDDLLKERYNNAYTTVRDLPDKELKAWLKELKDKDVVPF